MAIWDNGPTPSYGATAQRESLAEDVAYLRTLIRSAVSIAVSLVPPTPESDRLPPSGLRDEVEHLAEDVRYLIDSLDSISKRLGGRVL